MEKKINNNGYEYIDLGLPSGTLWAACNVGASKPTDYGQYFQWADTNGYTIDQVGKDKQFNWNNYKWGSTINFTKYTSIGETLDSEDDAAHANMGGDWHIPSPAQIWELIYNTIADEATLDGVKGMKFTSKKDVSKFIFVPAAGVVWDGSNYFAERYGNIWSSMLSTEFARNAQYLYFGYTGASQYLYLCSRAAFIMTKSRTSGLSVRGVIG